MFELNISKQRNRNLSNVRMLRQFWTGLIDMLEPMRGLGFQAFGTSASSNPNRLSKTTNSYCGAGGLEKCNNTHFLFCHKK